MSVDKKRRFLKKRRIYLPHIGQRIIKTAVAVYLSLMFYVLRGKTGAEMRTEAAITAIICMQPYVKDTRTYAMNRLAGTLVGAAWGLLYILVFINVSFLARNSMLIYIGMGLGILLAIYTAIFFHVPDASSLSAIVFLCIVIQYPDIEDPLMNTLEQIIGVFVGTVIAVAVNIARLPRARNDRIVFFLKSSDLIPDRFSQISSTVLFKLNNLSSNGARICLISEHAPAFFTSQMSSVSLNLPMIVMDGAAVYDVRENRYLLSEPIPVDTVERIKEKFDHMHKSFFIYTVHKNKTCIFHNGQYSEEEINVLKQLRSSPYRTYLDEEVYEESEIVCIKVIDRDSKTMALTNSLLRFARKEGLRLCVRPQSGYPGVSGLYIYSAKANVRDMEVRLMELLKSMEPDLTSMELMSPNGYRTEYDAMLLLAKVRNTYAPVSLFGKRLQG